MGFFGTTRFTSSHHPLPLPFKRFSGDGCSPLCLDVLCRLTGAWKMVRTLASTWLLLLPHKQSDKAETGRLTYLPTSASKNQPRECVMGPVWSRGQQENKTECYLFPSPLLASCPPSWSVLTAFLEATMTPPRVLSRLEIVCSSDIQYRSGFLASVSFLWS